MEHSCLCSQQGKPSSSTSYFSHFLLNTDLPLFLAAPQQKAVAAGDAQAGSPQPVPTQSNDGDVPCHPTSLAILRRIWVQTPPSSDGPLLACRPVVELKQVAPLQLPTEALEAMTRDPAGPSSSSSRKVAEGLVQAHPCGLSTHKTALVGPGDLGTPAPRPMSNALGPTGRGIRLGQIQFAPSDEVRLPPDSLCVITLPSVYAAPISWLVQSAAPRANNAVTDPMASDDSHIVDSIKEHKLEALCPIIPIQEAWPFTAKVAKGTILFPCSLSKGIS